MWDLGGLVLAQPPRGSLPVALGTLEEFVSQILLHAVEGTEVHRVPALRRERGDKSVHT